jgi:membrane fusion protein (multidrug efflux system)
VPRRPLLIAGAVIALAALAWGASAWWHYRSHVSTDDAYVEGTVATVSAKVSGHIVELHADDNKPVKKGDLLLRIDERDYRARLEQAKAAVGIAESRLRAATARVAMTREQASGQMAQAQASSQSAASAMSAARDAMESSRATVASRRANLGAAQAELERAKAAWDRARQDLDRVSALVKQDLVAKRDFDQAVTDERAAEAAVRGAEQRVVQAQRDLAGAESDLKIRDTGYEPQQIGIQMAEARGANARAARINAEAMQQEVRVRDAERELAAAQLKEALADLAVAELNLEHAQVRAPVDGVVAKRTVEIGQIVQVGQPLLAVVPLQDVWIQANFKETQLAGVKAGMPATIQVDGVPGKTYKGTVDSIAAGTGARFSLLPPENATGNWVKVVQRVPVKIRLDGKEIGNPHTLRAGMSAYVSIKVK